MFEKWAIAFATKIKEANPEETEPLDVLVFGFTIMFNLLFTFCLIMLTGWMIGMPLVVLQVFLSFMLIRILTGGNHLDQSLACSIMSFLLVFIFIWLPVSPILIAIYFIISLFCIIRYAPYYEADQVKHSKEWEQKKKRTAIIWIFVSLSIYLLFSQPGFLFGVLLQALLLTPAGLAITGKINMFITKGGEKDEKNC